MAPPGTWSFPSPDYSWLSVGVTRKMPLGREGFYCQRGDPENRIKELKLDLKADRLSWHRFQANQLRLPLHAAA